MALSIKNPEVDRLARELSEITGENITETIRKSLEQRLERETGRKEAHSIRFEIQRIQDRVSRLEKKDDRSDEELTGFNEQGIPD